MEQIKTRYRVDGMDCGSCAMKVDTAVRRVDGVSDVTVSATAGTMTIVHDGSPDFARIEKTISGLGYSATPLSIAAGEPAGGVVQTGCTLDGTAHDHSHDHDHGKTPARQPASGVGLHSHSHEASEGTWWASGKARLAGLSGLALLVSYAVGYMFPDVAKPAFLLSLMVGLLPIAKRALMAARAGTPFSIETLMTIAAIGAVLIDATEEAAMVVFLFLLGELLEGVAATRARASIRSLSNLVPKTAFVEVEGVLREVAAADLKIGDLLVVRPGDRIAADGVIVDGESAIDEAPVTGESVPVRKGPDASVFAGTINGDGALRIRISASATDNTIARVIRLVEEAQESKAPTERFIDRFSRIYTPGVLVVGALIATLPPLMLGGDWSDWLYKGLAILLIGCPCALVISTPAAIAASLSSGARLGLLMKGGAVLEQMGKITTVAFDKTGTLTEGKPKVTDIVVFDGSEDEILKSAAALEAGSSHPLAKAILDRAAGLALPTVAGNRAIGGKGVSGLVSGVPVFLGALKAVEGDVALTLDQRSTVARLNGEGKTVSLLVIGGRLAGAIALRDEPRPDAIPAIGSLQALGIKTLMLTGDNHLTAQAIGATLGMDVKAELMPEDKQRIVRQLQARGEIVAKIGDGINDAPALAAADIGIAMGGGTDVALETADAAILHGRVADVERMIRISRSTMANIRQNITIALGLKLVFLFTTILGITGLWPAILADTGATVLVTLNALRLLKPPAWSVGN